jgi:hypothetical protein
MAKKKSDIRELTARALDQAGPDPLFAATPGGNSKYDLGHRVHLNQDIEYSDTTVKAGRCGTVVEVHELVSEAWYGVFFDGDIQPKRIAPESRLDDGCLHT